MNSIGTQNAIIKSVSISNADHGCLSIWIQVDYGSSCQGFGGYNLYSPSMWKGEDGFKGKIAKNYCGHFIWKCLEVAGVMDWSQLPGKTIRVKSDNSKIHEIGHIVKDIWFNPSVDFRDD